MPIEMKSHGPLLFQTAVTFIESNILFDELPLKINLQTKICKVQIAMKVAIKIAMKHVNLITKERPK